MYDIVIIGHACIDHFNTQPNIRLGGTVLYGGLTAANLGKNVGIITPIARNLPKEFKKQLKHENIDLHALDTEVQTEFTHFLKGDTRIINLEKKSMAIQARHVPENFTKARICLLGAVCDEIDLSVLEHFTAFKVPLALELQGFVRKFSKNGKVTLKKSWNFAPDFLNSTITFL